MPWNILGIEQDGASERDVKRAYARLLKVHRPEDDPEGFKRVHDAYQEALNQLKWAREFGDASSSFIDVGSPADESFDLERGVEPPPPPGQPPPPPASARPPNIIMMKDVDVDEVLADLEAGDDRNPMRVLNAILLTDKRDLRLKFATAILAEPARFANEASTRFTRRLAMLIAFRYSHRAERLLNMLFQHLAPTERDYALAAPTWLLGLGPTFKPVVNKQHWDFWCAAFANPELIDWDSPLARFAVDAVDRLGFWEGYQIVDQIVPSEKQRWNQRAAAGENIHPPPPSRKVEGMGTLVISALFIVAMGFTAFTNLTDFLNPPPEPERQPPPFVFAEPGWTKHIDVGSCFVNAQTQESMELGDHKVHVLGKRAHDGSLRYTTVIEQYVREFPTRTAYEAWQDKHR